MKEIAMFCFWCFVIAACLKGCDIIDNVEVNVNAIETTDGGGQETGQDESLVYPGQ